MNQSLLKNNEYLNSHEYLCMIIYYLLNQQSYKLFISSLVKIQITMEQELSYTNISRKLDQWQKQIKQNNLHKITKEFTENLHNYGISFFIFLLVHKLYLKWLEQIKIQHENESGRTDLILDFYIFVSLLQPDYNKLVEIEIKPQTPNPLQSIFKIDYYRNLYEKKGEIVTNNQKNTLKDRKQYRLSEFVRSYIKISDSQSNIHQINSFILQSKQINYQLQQQTQSSIYDQICVNWIRKKLDQQKRNEISKSICCKMFFRKGDKVPFAENDTIEFKRYDWPIENTLIVFHLKKTIVGFLNSKGGIIYIGIYQDKGKVIDIEGMVLKKDEIMKVVHFFRSIVSDIEPQHLGFKGNPHPQVINNKYIINDYVSIEFLPVIDEKTMLQIRKQGKNSKQIEKSYIVKIFVKIGHPKHLYHLVRQTSLDFFVRKDRNVEKMQFTTAYNKIYEKLAVFEKYLQNKHNHPQLNRKIFHNDCLYTMDISKIEID